MGLVKIPNNRFLMDKSVAIHGNIEKYRVNSTEPIHEGEFIQFTTNTEHIVTKPFLNTPNATVKSIPIDKQTVLLAYIDQTDDTMFGAARIATIRLNDITFSEPLIFATTQVSDLNITKLNIYTYLISYIDGTTGFGMVSLLRVLNGEITVLATSVVSAVVADSINIMAVSEISAIVAFYLETGYAQFSRITVVDNEITIDDPFIFNTTVTTGISLALRDDKKAIALSYMNDTNDVYVQQISLGSTWVPSTALMVANASTQSISHIKYVSNSELVLGIDSNLYIVADSNGSLSFADTIPVDSSLTICDVVVLDSYTIGACVSNSTDTFGIYTLKNFNNKYHIANFNTLISSNVPLRGTSVTKISDSLALLSYISGTTTLTSLITLDDVGVTLSKSSFTSEGLAIESGDRSDIVQINTIEDQLTTYVGTHTADNIDEPITVGDFVNRVDKYSLNEYGVSEENILHDMYTPTQDFFHYGLFDESQSFIKIDNDRVLLIYGRIPTSLGQSSTALEITRVCVQICKITGTVAEFGNIIILNDQTPGGADSSYYGIRSVSAVVLNSDRILIAYGNGTMDAEDDEYGQNGGLWSTLLQYDDITLTRITPDRDMASKLSTRENNAELLKVDENHVVVQFGKRTSMITTNGNTLSITDTNISFGLYYMTGGISSIRYAMLDSNRMVVVANHQAPVNATVRNSLRLYIYHFVDGMVTTVNVDTPYFILGENDIRLVRSVGLAKLNDRRIAVSYAITDTTDKYIIVLDIESDGTVKEVSRAVYHTGQLFFTELHTLSPNKVLITFIENSSRFLIYKHAYIDNDGNITISDELTLPRTANTMYTISLNQYKAITLYPVIHDDTPYRKAYHLRLRAVGTDGTVPDFNVTELINDNDKLTRSNTVSDAYGFVRNITPIIDETGVTVDKEYDIFEINPFMDRVKNQIVINCKIADDSEYIKSGDFIQFTNLESSPIEISKATSGNINGVAIEQGNPSDLINIRTIYKQ